MSRVSQMASFAEIDVNKLVKRIRQQTLNKSHSQRPTTPVEKNGAQDEIQDNFVRQVGNFLTLTIILLYGLLCYFTCEGNHFGPYKNSLSIQVCRCDILVLKLKNFLVFATNSLMLTFCFVLHILNCEYFCSFSFIEE